MYEFHGIKWLNDNELDADSPERRGPGWAHAYVPVIGPEGEATGTAHVPIYMPRVYKELKRFALRVYKAAGGTTDVEMSGWWSSIKKGFKKMAKIVAKNKVLRAVAEKGLQAAIPGGATVSEKAAGILEDLVSKYRGGSTEAANQIKGLLEKANRGSEQDAKVLDEVRREYIRQQASGLPALLNTMASGDVVVYDPIYGAKKKMSKKQYRRQAAQRKRQAVQRRATPASTARRSPLRNSPTTLRQAPTMSPMQRIMSQQQPYAYPQMPGYPQDYGYPSTYAPESYSDQGPAPYDPEQEADDEADLQEAVEENLARISNQSSEEDIDSEMEGDEYFDVGAKRKKMTPEQKARRAQMEQKRKQQGQKQAQKVTSMQQAQIVRAQKEKLMKEAQRRIQAEKDARHAESDKYKDALRGLRQQLRERDLEDDARAAMEEQAEQYEKLLQQNEVAIHSLELQAARAATPQAPAPAPAPAVYDEERGEEYDTADPLVREALAKMQQDADVEAENDGEE